MFRIFSITIFFFFFFQRISNSSLFSFFLFFFKVRLVYVHSGIRQYREFNSDGCRALAAGGQTDASFIHKVRNVRFSFPLFHKSENITKKKTIVSLKKILTLFTEPWNKMDRNLSRYFEKNYEIDSKLAISLSFHYVR